MPKVINVVGAIIVQEGKILCAQRGFEKALAGMWEFPGGKIEKDELPRTALMRELEEELMVKVEVSLPPFETTSYSYDFGTVNLTTFVCYLVAGEVPSLTEHIAIEWLKPEELDRLDWAPADIPAVQKLMMMGSQLNDDTGRK